MINKQIPEHHNAKPKKLRPCLRPFHITWEANFQGEEPGSTSAAWRASTFTLPPSITGLIMSLTLKSLTYIHRVVWAWIIFAVHIGTFSVLIRHTELRKPGMIKM